MATQAAVELLRANLAGPDGASAFSDAELAALLDAHDGSEPRARLVALRRLAAQAAALHDYSTGTSSESKGQVYAHYADLLDRAEAEVAALGATARAAEQATALGTAAVPIRFVF